MNAWWNPSINALQYAITNAWLNWSLFHSFNIQCPSREHYDTLHPINPPFSSIPAHFLYSSFAPLETSTSVHWFLVQLLLDFYSFSRYLECWDLRHALYSPLFFSASWPELSWLALCHWFTCILSNLKWFWSLCDHNLTFVLFWLIVVSVLNLVVKFTSLTQV